MPYVLKGRIHMGGYEYIVSCHINDAGELVFITNLGKELNAGKLPLSEQNYQDIINYINEHIAEGDMFTDEFYNEIIKYINENVSEGDLFTDEFYDEIINYINENVSQGDMFTDEFYEEIIKYIEEKAANGDVFTTEEVYKDFIDYINNHIAEGDLFTDEFYDKIINYINEHPRELDIADIPPYVAVKKTDSTVTVHARRYDEIAEVWAEKVTTITLDEDGFPTTVTQDDGTTTSLTWEGFE